VKFSTPDSVDLKLRNLEQRVHNLERLGDSVIIPVNQRTAYRIRTTAGDNYVHISTFIGEEAITLGSDEIDPDLVWTGAGAWYFSGSAGTEGDVFVSNGESAAPGFTTLTGTKSATFTVNTDAAATTTEVAEYAAIGADGSIDLVKSRFITSGVSELVYLQMQRNRSGAGYSTIAPVFAIGVPGQTGSALASLQFNSGVTSAYSATLQLAVEDSYVEATATRYFKSTTDHSSTVPIFTLAGHATSSTCAGTDSIALGVSSTVYGYAAGAASTSENCVVLGSSTAALGTASTGIIIGHGASLTNGDFSVVIGANASTSNSYVTLIGASAVCGQDNCVVICAGGGNDISAPRTILIGDANATAGVWNMYLGPGLTGAATNDVTIGPCNATGSNQAASDLCLRAGLTTGNVNTSALKLQVSTIGASGTALNSVRTIFEVNSGFQMGFFGKTPFTRATAASITSHADLVTYLTNLGLLS
jgi:hypothetical protein